MIKDEFKFTKLNIILIVFNVGLVILCVLAAIQLIGSLRDKNEKIPELLTTADKSSTRAGDLTNTTTEETTITTTKKQGNLNSPYYDYNIDELFKDELVTKENITTTSEQKALVKIYFDILSYLYDVTNDELINTSYLLEHVKPGEKDMIIYNNHKYGIVYNGEALLNKIFFYSKTAGRPIKYMSEGLPIILEKDGNVYKLENTIGKSILHIDSYSLSSNMSGGTINGKIIYYNTNYKEQGLKTPDYKSAMLKLKYKTEDKMWKVESFDFPNVMED